jgi:PAS domain S-box-containing protein
MKSSLPGAVGADVNGHRVRSTPVKTAEDENLLRLCARNLLATPEERVFFKDLDSRFLMVSAGFLIDQAPGRRLEDVIGKTDFDFFRTEHAQQAMADERQVMASGVPIVGKVEKETFYDRPSAWVSTTKVPLRDEDGRIIGVFGISRDVTPQMLAEQALAESEERFRSIFEQAPLGILRLDAGNHIVSANRAACEVLGRTPDELRGTDLVSLFDPEDDGEGAGLLEQGPPGPPAPGQPEAGGPSTAGTASGRGAAETVAAHSTQRRARRPDGTVRVVQVKDVVIPDPHGRPQTLVATLEDVTEATHMADELRRASQMEAVGQLAGGIAHEINTPAQFISDNLAFLTNAWAPLSDLLGAVRTATAALRSGVPAGEVAELLEKHAAPADLDFVQAEVPAALAQSQSGIDRIATLVRAMKAFGRPDPSNPESTDINHLVEGALTVARSELKYVAEVTTELGEIPTVTCFPGAISQVVLNLLVNAAYAVGQNSAKTGRLGHIRVKTSASADQVTITVTDDGPGIADDVLPRIYQPFFTTKPFGRGTGQGLAMAWATVVEQHRGRISVSTSAAGTTFVVALPLTPPPPLTP